MQPSPSEQQWSPCRRHRGLSRSRGSCRPGIFQCSSESSSVLPFLFSSFFSASSLALISLIRTEAFTTLMAKAAMQMTIATKAQIATTSTTVHHDGRGCTQRGELERERVVADLEVL